MDDLTKLKEENKLLKTIVFNLFQLIEGMNFVSSRAKKSPEYQNIKDAIHNLKGE
ncbi:MAG: hypothetical protein O9264_08825 [Leptospira sp.]|nr:hypothetical protein [Leptospira sp.]